MANIDSSSRAPRANKQPGTTDATDFFTYSSSQKTLFSVRPGVPADGALEMASCFLDVARDCAYSGEGNFSNAAAYLIEMAKAVVDSLVRCTDSKPNDAETAFVLERLTALHESGTIIINPQAVKLQSDDAKDFLNWAGQMAEGGAQ